MKRTYTKDDAVGLCAWLRARQEVETAVPVHVSLGNVKTRWGMTRGWFGALYCLSQGFVATERAVKDGPMKAGELRRTYYLYLLGCKPEISSRNLKFVAVYDLPATRREPLERCFTHNNEWYIAFYKQTGTVTEHDPYGYMFAFSLHQVMNFGPYKDWKIDTGERRPYRRLPMTVRYLDEEPSDVEVHDQDSGSTSGTDG